MFAFCLSLCGQSRNVGRGSGAVGLAPSVPYNGGLAVDALDEDMVAVALGLEQVVRRDTELVV